MVSVFGLAITSTVVLTPRLSKLGTPTRTDGYGYHFGCGGDDPTRRMKTRQRYAVRGAEGGRGGPIVPAVRLGCDFMVCGSPALRKLHNSMGGLNQRGINTGRNGGGNGSAETGVRERPSPLHDIGRSTFWLILEPMDGCSALLVTAMVLAGAMAVATQTFDADMFELIDVLL